MVDLNSEFDKIWGTTTPKTNALGSSRAEEIRRLAQPKQPIQEGTFQAGQGKIFGTGKGIGQTTATVLNSLTQAEQNLGKDIGRGLLGGDKYFQKIQDQYTSNVDTLTKLAAKQTDPTKKELYLKMAKSDFEEGQKVGVDFKGRSWEQIAGDVLGVALDVGLTVSGLAAAKGAKAGIQGYKGLSTGQKFLKGATTGMKTGGTIGSAYGLTGGLQEGKDVGGVVRNTVEGGLTGATVGGVIGGVTPIVPDIIKATKELPNKIARGLELKTKSLSEIAATKAKDVGNLNIREQEKWRALQTKKIKAGGQKAIDKLQEESQDLMGGIEASSQSAKQLNTEEFNKATKQTQKIKELTEKKLQQSSIDTVIKEREPMRKLISEQGSTYEKLYNADVAPVKNVILKKDEVVAKIMEKLPGDIDITQKDVAERIINALKFDKNGNIKLGDLNKQVKALKPTGKTFNQLTTNIHDALGGIGELLQEKGADFSKSNTFWKEWVDVKKNIIQKFKPYTYSPVNTSQGAKFISDFASGNVNDKYLMDEITRRLGRDITKKEKELVKGIKLQENLLKDQALTQQMDLARIEADKIYQETVEKARLQFDIGKISEKTLEKINKVESVKWDSRMKAIARKFVTGIAAYLGIKGIEKTTGIDIPVI